VVEQPLLAEREVVVGLRAVERAVAELRRARRVATLATVRVETQPGDQLQIDFGQKHVRIADREVRIFALVVVLSRSPGVIARRGPSRSIRRILRSAATGMCSHAPVRPTARTRGKTEAGVKYVKRDALAGLAFDSFAALERHLTASMRVAHQRIHGTTPRSGTTYLKYGRTTWRAPSSRGPNRSSSSRTRAGSPCTPAI
jgi:transposase